MLLPSGPASTRCSVCRSDSGDLHAHLRSGARNGFAGPRDWEPKSTLSRPLSAAETDVRHLNPRKSRKLRAIRLSLGNVGSHRTAWWGWKDSNVRTDGYERTSPAAREAIFFGLPKTSYF